MNYDFNTALKRNMIDVAAFAIGCGIGMSGTALSAPALPVIGVVVLFSLSVDYAKEQLSN